MSWADPVRPPVAAGIQPGLLQEAVVTTANADGTVDVRLFNSRGGRASVRVINGLTLSAGQHVVLAHLDADPQRPVVLARL